jgi:DNA gyrase subunit A
MERNLTETLSQSFLDYAAYTIQRRAIPDVRDMLKFSTRQLLHAAWHEGVTHNKDFKKGIKLNGIATFSYCHGDSSSFGNYVRMAKPFCNNVCLMEAQGNAGTLMNPDDHAAPRYLELREAEITDILFQGLKKNAITEWEDTYDNLNKFPLVLPSIGYWNIVNPCQGIATSCATSTPGFNLREVNAAIIKLLKNPNASFNELYCVPDFPTGGYLINPGEVRQSLEQGQGKACRLRAKIDYDGKRNVLVITEVPYSVFTNTIVKQVREIIAEDEFGDIEDITDFTGKQCLIEIRLKKGANAANVLKRLYKDTSLEYSYGINMLMLDHGRFPRIFGWKDALQAYIDHIRECKRRELEYDFNKLKARNHILDGLLTAIADIDETIHIIKSSASSAAAKAALMRHYDIDEDQAKAILDIKLARLAHLEALELESERKQNQLEIDRLSDILSHQDKLDEILISILQEVADKFGDERRTKILTITEEPEEEIEEKEINVNIAGDKLRINPKKVAGQNISTTNLGTLVCVSSAGQLYKISMRDVEEGKTYSVSQLTKAADAIVGIYDLSNINLNKYWVFITKNGLIKKSPVKEYNYVGRQGTKMLKLKDDDAVIAVYLLSGDKDMISVHTSDKFYAHYSGQEIPESGKAAMGVKAINLGANQTIIKAQLNPTGLKITGRAVKGVKE